MLKLERISDTIHYYQERERKLSEFIEKVIDYEIILKRLKQTDQVLTTDRVTLEKLRTLYIYGKVRAIDTLLIAHAIDKNILEYQTLRMQCLVMETDLQFTINSKLTLTLCHLTNPSFYTIDTVHLATCFLQYNHQKEVYLDSFKVNENIKRTSKSHGITTSIAAGVGINQSAQVFNQLLNAPSQRQNVSIGTSIPLTGWQNYTRAKEIAHLEMQVYHQTMKELRFSASVWALQQYHTHIYVHQNLNLLTTKLNSLQKIAMVQLEQLLAGKSDVTEYNATTAQITQTQAEHLNNIKQLLLLRFKIREKTFWDIENNELIWQ